MKIGAKGAAIGIGMIAGLATVAQAAQDARHPHTSSERPMMSQDEIMPHGQMGSHQMTGQTGQAGHGAMMMMNDPQMQRHMAEMAQGCHRMMSGMSGHQRRQ